MPGIIVVYSPDVMLLLFCTSMMVLRVGMARLGPLIFQFFLHFVKHGGLFQNGDNTERVSKIRKSPCTHGGLASLRKGGTWGIYFESHIDQCMQFAVVTLYVAISM